MIEIVESNRLLGVAKSIQAELEKLPLAAHGAVLGMINTLAQHRELTEKLLKESTAADANKAMQERQMKLMEAEQARQAAEQVAKASQELPKKLVLA